MGLGVFFVVVCFVGLVYLFICWSGVGGVGVNILLEQTSP